MMEKGCATAATLCSTGDDARSTECSTKRRGGQRGGHIREVEHGTNEAVADPVEGRSDGGNKGGWRGSELPLLLRRRGRRSCEEALR
jgi:hypothetical protein